MDFVGTHKTDFGKSKLNLSLGMTFNKTEIVKFKDTPDLLQAGTTAKIAIMDTINIALIETAQPRQKIIFSANYSIGKFSVLARATHFGSVAAWEKPAALPHIKQEFGSKTLLDASIGFDITPKILLTVGSNNITDVYPDKVLSHWRPMAQAKPPITEM